MKQALFTTLVLFGVLLLLVTRCAPPKVSELLKDGVDCKALITVPEDPPARGDSVEVDVKIFNCKESVNGTNQVR